MDMAAQNGVDPVALGVSDDRAFKFTDEIDRVLNSFLGVSAERPIAEPESASDEVDQRIKRKEELVAKVARECEPARVLHDRIQLVTMDNEKASSIRRGVNKMVRDGDVTVIAGEAAEELVVISWDINDPGAFAGFAQQFLDYVVMLLRPINSASHLPDIDQVANDIEGFEFVKTKELEESGRITVARAEVDIGNPTCAQGPSLRRPDDAEIPLSRGWVEGLHAPQK